MTPEEQKTIQKIPTLRILCPELQDAMLVMAKHIKDCERCRELLAAKGLEVIEPFHEAFLRLEHTVSLLGEIKPTN